MHASHVSSTHQPVLLARHAAAKPARHEADGLKGKVEGLRGSSQQHHGIHICEPACQQR